MNKKILVVFLVALSLIATTGSAMQSMNSLDLDPVLQELGDIVSSVEHKGIQNSLAAKVNAANDAFTTGDTEGAVAALEGLISQVNDQSGNKVSADEAEVLVQLAQNAIDNIMSTGGIYCPPPNVVVEYGGVKYCVAP